MTGGQDPCCGLGLTLTVGIPYTVRGCTERKKAAPAKGAATSKASSFLGGLAATPAEPAQTDERRTDQRQRRRLRYPRHREVGGQNCGYSVGFCVEKIVGLASSEACRVRMGEGRRRGTHWKQVIGGVARHEQAGAVVVVDR